MLEGRGVVERQQRAGRDSQRVADVAQVNMNARRARSLRIPAKTIAEIVLTRTHLLTTVHS